MDKRIGQFIKQKIGGENYNAYIPQKLPPMPEIKLNELYHLIDKATKLVSDLNNITNFIPNKSLFIYMYVRKEALLSSQIEGTQSSFSDLILFENKETKNLNINDVEEVSNYVKALNYGIERINNGFPLSLRLIKEIHAILLNGSRGANKLPGEFRKSQNWIGGTRPGNALFVPPPPEYLMEILGDFEKFIHDEDVKLPILIKAGIMHVQFETIHPFLDGNGRLGRLLIIIMLIDKGLISSPILYLSLYLKQNSSLYYDLLQQVRNYGKWEAWLEFFLEGVSKTAKQAIDTTQKLNDIFIADLSKINNFGKLRFNSVIIYEYLKKLPQITVPKLAEDLNISAPTARKILNLFVENQIIEEITNKKRDKIYVFKKYLNILEEGTEII